MHFHVNFGDNNLLLLLCSVFYTDHFWYSEHLPIMHSFRDIRDYKQGKGGKTVKMNFDLIYFGLIFFNVIFYTDNFW